MLTQNSELRKDRVWNWTLPAWGVRRTDGKAVNVCPQAVACVKVCYARNGTYNFPTVKAAHVRNLERVLDDLNGWTVDMLDELSHKRYAATGSPRLPDLPRDHLTPQVAALLDSGAACIRIHDAGDLLCVLAPSHRIGIPANNIPAFNKRLAGRTFSELEAQTHRTRAAAS